jgi:lipopolysaccharide/colanic/teichoic acid biosynthesis glycosyltransferase
MSLDSVTSVSGEDRAFVGRGETACRFSRSVGEVHIAGGFRLSEKFVKRLCDVALSSMMIVLFAPIMALLSLYIVTVYRVSPIFRHNRVGLDGKVFSCLKFRTMVPNAREVLDSLLAEDPVLRREWEETRKLKNDPRVFPGLGNLMRQSSLDELPQIFNVFFGDMSIVGPRPVTREELVHYGSDKSYYEAVKPGITGAWQIGGRSDTSYEERVSLDVWYVRNLSLRLDLQIFLKTVLLFVTGRLSGAV